MGRLVCSDEANALLAPLRTLLDAALARLPAGPPVHVQIGSVPGFYALNADGVVLASELLGPDLHHPSERPGEVRLDRWRRAVCSVLEACAMTALAAGASQEPDLQDWRWVGAAIEAADHASPELGLGLPDLLDAAAHARPGPEARQGVAVYRALRRSGQEPWEAALRWIRTGAGPSARAWLDIGAWVLGAGLVAEAAVPVDVPAPVDIPVRLPPWSWARIEVPAHPRGGLVRCEGGGVIDEAFAKGGVPLRTLGGALSEEGALKPDIGGPVGTWDNVSAQGFGQVFGVRGITWTLHADGRLEMLLADAFAGPPAALAMAEEVGTSGLAPGRWVVAGPQKIRIAELVTSGLTMHGRQASPFALPAGGGLGDALQAMQEGDWTWRFEGAELFMVGTLFGSTVEMRFKPSTF